jgi:hypothetical protein
LANVLHLPVFQDENVISYQPKKAWRFNEDTTLLPAKGYYQGMAGKFGEGRIVVLGDSGMISAHLIGRIEISFQSSVKVSSK